MEAESKVWIVGCLGPTSLRLHESDAIRNVDLSPLQRRLLAWLALGHPRGMDVDELVARLWPERSPPSAKTSLHNTVSRVRRASHPSVIETTPNGYRIGVSIDVVLFEEKCVIAERLASRNEWPLAMSTATEAVDIWRGEPFVDLGDDVDVSVRQVALSERRRALDDERLEAEAHLGRHALVVVETEAQLSATPFDERRWARLVRSLDALGRRGEALAAIDRARRSLRRSLGVDIGRELSNLEQRILNVPRSTAPALRLPIRGRDDIVQRIVAQAEAGESSLLVGDLGSGRTAVLQEVRRAMRRRGWPSAFAQIDANPGHAASVLDDLLDDLGLRVTLAADAVGQFAEAIDSIGGETPVVLLVDDLGLAGPSTREALRRVVETKVAIVCASCRLTDEVPAWIERVEVLPALTDDDIESLVFEFEVLSGPLDPDTRSTLRSQSGGNPLLLLHLLSGFKPQGESSSQAQVVGSSNSRLNEIVDGWLDPWGVDVRRAIETAAVIGDSGSLEVLGSLVPARTLESVMEVGLIDEVAPGRFSFRHSALAVAIAQRVPTGRRQEIHHAVAMESRRRGEPATTFVLHSLAAAEIDARGAADDAVSAAAQCSREGMHRDAASWLGRALEVLERFFPTDDRRALEIRTARADAMRLDGNPGHLDELVQCVAASFVLDDPRLIATATYSLLQFGGTSQPGDGRSQALEFAERSLQRLEGTEEWGLIAAATSLPQSIFGDSVVARARVATALDVTGDSSLRRLILPYALLAFGHPSDLERRDATARELETMARANGDVSALFSAHHQQMVNALVRGRFDEAREHHRAMAVVADRIGSIGVRWEVAYGAVAGHLFDCDLATAERQAVAAYEVLAPFSVERARAVLVSQLFAIRLFGDRLDEMVPELEALADAQPAYGAWSALLAASLVERAPDRARRLADTSSEIIAPDFAWLAANWVVGWVAVRTRDVALARAQIEILRPWAHLHASPTTCVYGSVGELLADLDAVTTNEGVG